MKITPKTIESLYSRYLIDFDCMTSTIVILSYFRFFSSTIPKQQMFQNIVRRSVEVAPAPSPTAWASTVPCMSSSWFRGWTPSARQLGRAARAGDDGGRWGCGVCEKNRQQNLEVAAKCRILLAEMLWFSTGGIEASQLGTLQRWGLADGCFRLSFCQILSKKMVTGWVPRKIHKDVGTGDLDPDPLVLQKPMWGVET